MLPADVAIDDKTRAHRGRRVDVGIEMRMLDELARRMVIEVPHTCAASERTRKTFRVRFHADVEDRELVACLGVYALQQTNVTFDARDELSRAICRRRMESQLM